MSPEVSNRLRNAFTRFQQGNLIAAEQACEEILALDPENADALHLLGIAIGQQGRNEQAVELLQKALKKKPTDIHILNNLAQTLLRLEQFSQAGELLERAVNYEPGFTEGHYNLARTYEGAGDILLAEKKYKKALELNPEFADAAANLAAIKESRKQRREAGELAQRALKIAPMNFIANITQAKLDAHNTQWNQVITRLKNLTENTELSPVNFAIAQGRLGKAYENLGQYGQAFECYQAANNQLHKHYF
ncbi:MAG: tetratricopeptide repeat protein, partial [Gammaproteobacteria bacterium]|nr:tetratricopeptide repeat protein [Gammaproteobacteria bacterium]